MLLAFNDDQDNVYRAIPALFESLASHACLFVGVSSLRFYVVSFVFARSHKHAIHNRLTMSCFLVV